MKQALSRQMIDLFPFAPRGVIQKRVIVCVYMLYTWLFMNYYTMLLYSGEEAPEGKEESRLRWFEEMSKNHCHVKYGFFL